MPSTDLLDEAFAVYGAHRLHLPELELAALLLKFAQHERDRCDSRWRQTGTAPGGCQLELLNRRRESRPVPYSALQGLGGFN
jgi:hypothetical protein